MTDRGLYAVTHRRLDPAAGNPLWTSSAPSSYPVNLLKLKEDEEEMEEVHNWVPAVEFLIIASHISKEIEITKLSDNQQFRLLSCQQAVTSQCANEAQLTTSHMQNSFMLVFNSKQSSRRKTKNG